MEVQRCFQGRESHYPGVQITWDFHVKTCILKIIIFMWKEQTT